jgi:hypothetical protein
MGKNPLIGKCLVVGIILLFVGIACSPAISAYDDTILSKSFSIPKKDDMVSITILEYRPDGTIGKSVVKLSKIQAEKLRGELNNVKDLDTRLSIYKKYNLIPQDVTAETLRLGMEEKAQRLGLTKEKLEQFASNNIASNNWKNNRVLFPFNIYIDTDCHIFANADPGIMVPIGLSLFTMFINNFLISIFPNFILMLPSVDLSIRFPGSRVYIITTGGSYPDVDTWVGPWATKIVGFVGFSWIGINYLAVGACCEGYCAYVQAIVSNRFSSD